MSEITETAHKRYSELALKVLNEDVSVSCTDNTISKSLYNTHEVAGIADKAVKASLGCGNPVALIQLYEGETVLDLGSGGGIDVFLSARRVGKSGFAYGLDMSDEMLELARKNAAESGIINVNFLKGDIANIPLPANSVDVIISNCVINLAADKTAVLKEAYRVLKPGGRFAVSDIVIHGGLPEGITDSPTFRREISAWMSCIAGALTDAEYREGLTTAGFKDLEMVITNRYEVANLGGCTPVWFNEFGAEKSAAIISRFASTFVRATKPI
jgi:ubiquinone/menaquinone biosynthesis C-methylase UbiE